MSDCKHETFDAHCTVKRLSDVEDGPITSYGVDVRITCAECQTPFKFLGVGVGLSPIEPLTDVDGTELRAPIVPLGEEELVGRVGYRMSMRPERPQVVE